GDRGALLIAPEARADQLALLRPDASASREDPRGSGIPVVAGAAEDRRVAVRRESDGEALNSVSHRTRPDELGSLGEGPRLRGQSARENGGHRQAQCDPPSTISDRTV